MPQPRSIEARIHDRWTELPDSERKLAAVILEFPGDLSAYTATELTALAGVSKATATRLVQRLGFASFEECRLQARERRNWGSPLYMESKATGGGWADVRGYLNDEIALLERTATAVPAELLETAAERIVAARRVWLAGFRNGHFLAGYLRWQLVQFRGDVHPVAAPGETLGEYTADFLPDDLLVVVALRRRTRALIPLMEAARRHGTPILLLTDPTARRVPALADWVLTVETRSAYPFDSCGPALAVLRLLALRALARAGKRGRAHLERVEREQEALESFN